MYNTAELNAIHFLELCESDFSRNIIVALHA